VLRAAAELSYRPDRRARLLGRTRSRTIGVAFGLHHEFHGELVEQLYLAAKGLDYDLALGAVAPSRPETEAVRFLLEYRCEALILVGSFLRQTEIEHLADTVPVVAVARALRGAAVDTVRTDDVFGAQLAVDHLLGLGHRRIVHVDGQRAPGAAQRRRGYRAAMTAAAVQDAMRLIPGGLTEADGERATRELLRIRPAPTAVFAFNDHCAAGLLAAVRGAGVDVPARLSVVGYDNSSVASLETIALTTVAQDSGALARLALERAIGWAEGRQDRSADMVVPPQLVVRATTARARP
jgi:DNA-binding LacI/PurR family transcriptional regulator